MSEITEELFYTIVNSGDRNFHVDRLESYADVWYEKHGVILFTRQQSTGNQFYIVDINK